MGELKVLVFLHVLTAVIWAGYYMLLSIKVIPSALKHKDINILKSFEKQYHKIVMYALLLQVITGFRMSMKLLPMGMWFDFANPISAGITFKLIFLALIVILTGLNISIFSRKNNLTAMAIAAYLITLVSILLIYTGINFRFAGM